jgi:hypothetical protein
MCFIEKNSLGFIIVGFIFSCVMSGLLGYIGIYCVDAFLTR